MISATEKTAQNTTKHVRTSQNETFSKPLLSLWLKFSSADVFGM